MPADSRTMDKHVARARVFDKVPPPPLSLLNLKTVHVFRLGESRYTLRAWPLVGNAGLRVKEGRGASGSSSPACDPHLFMYTLMFLY